MIETPDIERPSKDLIEGLKDIGSATAAGELRRLGIRDPHIRGPVAWSPGKSVVGPALTLQCMPLREDVYGGGEYVGPEQQLHRHVLYHTQPGDIVVVDARGDLASGIFGEMMLTYFKGRYHVKGLYFLDEPEAALSPTSQIKFLNLLQDLAAEGQVQFIIATHSPILLAYPDAQIFSFDEGHIEEVTYEETAHYRIYKQFFTDRGAYLTSSQ